MQVRCFNIALTFALVLLFWAGGVFASTTDGTLSGYAWSSQIGWINFGWTLGNVHLTDTAMTGYAWNENTGRINLAPTQSGVTNNSEGTLSGRAWNEGTGWINFSGVSVSSAGVFSGTATGDNSVSINFGCTKCNVTTDWRPASSRSSTVSVSGGGGGGLFSAPFSILINRGAAITNSQTVKLNLEGGSNVLNMMVSNYADFRDAKKEPFRAEISWELIAGDGPKKVYAKFFNNSGLQSDTVFDDILLNTKRPFIRITSLEPSYKLGREVIIGGVGEPNASVTFSLPESYGSFQIDSRGNWFISLGFLPQGSYSVPFFAQDASGNKSETVTASFVVAGQEPVIPPLPQEPSIIEKISEGLQFLIPKFLRPKPAEKPQPIVIIPKETPLAFKKRFHYISQPDLEKLVLAPLPQNVKLLAEKFPKLKQTFSDVGVNRFTDVKKLKNANLKLPTLTQTALPQTDVSTRKLADVKGVPLVSLPNTAKTSIPSEVVFAKAAGGLIDYNIALSLSNKGDTEQTVYAVVGQQLELVVRTEGAAKSVVGYIVFKSKKTVSELPQLPANYFGASLLFANPVLSEAALPQKIVSLEGSKFYDEQVAVQKGIILRPGGLPKSAKENVEERFVLAKFEYEFAGDNLYTANIVMPVVDGTYEIITVVNYEDIAIGSKEIRLITVVDPEGYIYEQNGRLQTRVAGAIVSLYWLNPENSAYELWPASSFQQENPQTTDVRGTYSFLVPNGYYYLKVDTPGYQSFEGKPFEVKEGSGVRINIELKPHAWWLRVIDWKTTLLVLVIILLLYNFYKDKMRERALRRVV